MNLNKKLISLVAATAIFSNVCLNAEEIIEPSGLNQIQEILASDTLLKKKVSPEAIAEATQSITKMNTLIKQAIKVNGLANDGYISVADVRDINSYLSQYHLQEWYELRGTNAGKESTGYYLVDRKGVRTATTILNSQASRVWGKIYDIGFATNNKNRLLNAQANKSATFSTIGYYLDEILQKNIENGSLYNAEYEEVVGTTGTKLDMIVQSIFNDEGLLRNISTTDMREGASSANAMNHLIVEAIKAEGLANDSKLTTADIRTLNNYLVENHREKWALLHGDDENGEETGYHNVQNDGASSRMFADNVMNSVADGIYHLGFPTDRKNRLENEDGNANKRFEKVAWWLDTSLKADLVSGALNNNDYEEIIGTTGTSLDKIVPFIYNNPGLLLKVSMEDIRAGAYAANAMNEIIVDSIKATQIATDDYISKDDVKTLNKYIVANYEGQWAFLHGDDENGEETGYHRIQNDGATGSMYNKNIINKLADGIYHLGFYTTNKNRLLNEDGNKNVSFSNVAYWMNKSFEQDYKSGVFK